MIALFVEKLVVHIRYSFKEKKFICSFESRDDRENRESFHKIIFFKKSHDCKAYDWKARGLRKRDWLWVIKLRTFLALAKYYK